MLGPALAIAGKDLRLAAGGGQGPVQAVLLGLLLIFVFSLSRPAGQPADPQAAAAVFWLATVFGLVLIFNTLYSLEEGNSARTGLLLAPVPAQSVWLGKLAAGGVLLLMIQVVFGPAIIVFLNQDPAGSLGPGLATLALVDAGLVVLGSLLGALAQGQAARESLLSVILFPLLAPLLLAGIRMGAAVFDPTVPVDEGWLPLTAAFVAVFAGLSLVVFPFVFGQEE
jgi:heme exporter protein B